jgi:hypothetical protein
MATAANVVKLKRSAVAGRVPATTDLQLGELALNTYDGRVYLKKSVASVESIVAIQQVTGGTGVAVSDSGVVSIGQDVATTADVTFNSVSFPDETEQTTAWTGILPDPTYSGSSSIGNVTPAPLNLNNTGSSGENKTQLTLINTAGGGGTGSSIDFFTYTDAGNSLPGARLQAIDDSVYSANFSIVLKERYQSGNGQAGATWTFNSDGSTQFPGYKLPAGDGTSGYVLTTDGDGEVTWAEQAAATTPYQLLNNGYSATLDSGGTFTVDNLNVLAETNVTTQSFVVTSIGNLLLSEDGQVLELPPGQDPITTENYNSVIIGANTGSFYFKSQGVFQLPPGGDIIDANGNSVLSSMEGVRYTIVQTLTSEQKQTARSNIDAIAQEDAFVAAIIMG